VGVAVKLADEFKLISFHSSRFVGLTSYTISFAKAALICSISYQSKSDINGRSSC